MASRSGYGKNENAGVFLLMFLMFIVTGLLMIPMYITVTEKEYIQPTAVTIKTDDGKVVQELYGNIVIKQNGGDGKFSGLLSSGEVDWTSTGFTLQDVTNPKDEQTYSYGSNNILEFHKLRPEEAKEHHINLNKKVVAVYEKQANGKKEFKEFRNEQRPKQIN